MLRINQASEMTLHHSLGRLDRFNDYVFWIRDIEMTTQIYQGKNFAAIWQRDPDLIFKYPLLWLDYLEQSGKENYMEQMQKRHTAQYTNPQFNAIYYQIIKPDQSVGYIIDICFKCVDPENTLYVVGMAKQISPDLWEVIHRNKTKIDDAFDPAIQKEYFDCLKSHFLITPFISFKLNDPYAIFKERLLFVGVVFSPREIECLYYLCFGKTAKEIAKIISISSRTVETYMEQLLVKSNLKNRMELIAKFSRYLPLTP